MGMYALAGREPERRIRAVIRQYMLADVVRRREYIRNITVGTTGMWPVYHHHLVWLKRFIEESCLEFV